MRHCMVIILLLLGLLPQVMAEEVIGRLFFTSEQRHDLDQLRSAKQPRAIQTEAVSKQVSQPLSKSPEMKIQGYVKRNDGKQSTLWMNGKALQEDSNYVFE
jgi:hypothetical protein